MKHVLEYCGTLFHLVRHTAPGGRPHLVWVLDGHD